MHTASFKSISDIKCEQIAVGRAYPILQAVFDHVVFSPFFCSCDHVLASTDHQEALCIQIVSIWGGGR